MKAVLNMRDFCEPISRPHRSPGIARAVASAMAVMVGIAFSVVLGPVSAASAATQFTVGTVPALLAAFNSGDADVEISLTATLTVPSTSVVTVAPTKSRTLNLNGKNLTIKKPANNLAGLSVPIGSTLVIKNSGVAGTLTVAGGVGGAGIGGGSGFSAGNITIESGLVKATGGTNSAGIGGGSGGGGGAVTLSGGVTTATGGVSGAGIGGGNLGAGETVTIVGGKVTAKGGTGGAGIGGGSGKSGGSITVSGGDVTATGGGNGAGIGGGNAGGSGVITIDSAVIKATGGTSGAGIGGGKLGAGETIHILGGTVTAKGGASGAGIGGGNSGNSGAVTIDNGVIKATGGTSGAGIGGGNLGAGETVNIVGGTVTAAGGSSGAGIGGGSGKAGGSITVSGGDVTATGGGNGAGIGGGTSGNGGTVTVSAGTVKAKGGNRGAGIGGGYRGKGATVQIQVGADVTASGASGIAIGSGLSAVVVPSTFGTLSNAGLLTIPAGSSVKIPTSTAVQLTNESTGKIRNNGTLSALGKVENKGSIVNAGSIATPSNVLTHNTVVTLNVNGGDALSPTPLLVYSGTFEGGEVVLPDATHSGFVTFDGWFTAATGGTKVIKSTEFDAGAGPTYPKNLTLFAQWKPVQYQVTFATQGGSVVDPVSVDHDGQVTEPADPALAGHTFTGWFTTATGTTNFDFSTHIVAATEVFAQWSLNQYTVAFDAQGGSSVASITADYNTVVVKPTEPTWAGHTFTAWFTAATGGSAWDDTVPVTADLLVYARWDTIVPAPTPTATPTPIPVPTPTVTPKPTVYTPAGVKKHTVSFNTQGGNAIMPVIVNDSARANQPADATRAGHTFVGWFTSALSGEVQDFNLPISADTTVFAQWKLMQYRVSFDTQGGNSVSTATVDGNTRVTEPATPTRKGHTFVGWFTAASGGTAHDFSAGISADTTVFAHWKGADPVAAAPENPVPTATSSNFVVGGIVGGSVFLAALAGLGFFLRFRRL